MAQMRPRSSGRYPREALLKVGPGGFGIFLQHFFAPGVLPPGFTLPMQAIAVEFTASGTFVTLTNSMVLTIP